MFNLLKNESTKEKVLLKDDFMPLMRCLLEEHQGLEFLKSHPDFQERYADTVIMRIFYSCNIYDNCKITFREFKKSNLNSTIRKVCEEVDINKVRDYFSYEHFYVIYCLFWDLDSPENDQIHDFLIDKEDFSK